MFIGPERGPRLQVDGGEPFAIDSCEVRRDVDQSLLTAVLKEGQPCPLPVGARITLLAGPSVLFEGRAVAEDQVLDLMSTESDGELPGDETI
jgi:hypothetical protein